MGALTLWDREACNIHNALHGKESLTMHKRTKPKINKVPFPSEKTRGVSQNHGNAIYIQKYLKAKEEEEELWKLKEFTMQKYA
jgi:hypothetical protein